MKTVNVLIAARALIATEATYNKGRSVSPGGRVTPGRTVGVLFRDGDGMGTWKLSEAKCFCSLGALVAAVGSDGESSISGLAQEQLRAPFYATWGTTPATKGQRKDFLRAHRYLAEAVVTISGRNEAVYSFNDSCNTKHEDVLKAFDLAIKNAKRRHPKGGTYRNGTSRKPAINPDATV